MTNISVTGWMVIVAAVVAGGALEYWWMVGFERLDQRWGRKRKAMLGGLLIAIAVVASCYTVFRLHQ